MEPSMFASTINSSDKTVRHFRQILLWPLQLMPVREGAPIQKHWERLQTRDADNPWCELADEFTGDPNLFQERHYSEFVTFLPFVQRFLYGEGKGSSSDIVQESSIRVFRRNDVSKVRLTYPDPLATPITFEVAHVDLYFFYDIDVVILTVEIYAEDLPLPRAQDTLFRFGRAIRRTGNLKGEEVTARNMSNGCRPMTKCWRCPTMRNGRNISHSCAGTGPPASRRTGNGCWSRWFFTIPGRKA